MGKVVKSIFSGVGHAVSSIFGGRHRQEAPQLPPPVAQPVVNQPAPQSQQLNDYQNALTEQKRTIEAAHTKKLTELAESQKKTSEGQARSFRARRQGGIFTEAQTTNAGSASGTLG